MTNTRDAANRLTQTQRDNTTLQPIYNGLGDRVGQTVGATTTHFALDVAGLPEVIQTGPSTGSGVRCRRLKHLVKKLLLVKGGLLLPVSLNRLEPAGAGQGQKSDGFYRAKRIHEGFQGLLNQFFFG